MSNYENTVNWDYYRNLCGTNSSTIDLVMNAQKNPSATIQGVLQDGQQPEDFIQVLIEQFNKLLQDIVKMMDESENFSYIPNNIDLTKFIKDLIAQLNDISLPKLAMLIETYFPSGYEVNYQGLHDLNDAFAAIADGHRKVFDKVIDEISSYKDHYSPEAGAYIEQSFEEYWHWAAPRIYHACLYFPSFIEYKIEEYRNIGDKNKMIFYDQAFNDQTEDTEKEVIEAFVKGELFTLLTNYMDVLMQDYQIHMSTIGLLPPLNFD